MESNFESIFCVNISKIININPKKGQLPLATIIHEGSDCAYMGRALWNRRSLRYDPWAAVRYYAYGDHTAAKKVRFYIGFSMAHLIHRTVVIYDYDGAPIACSKLEPVTKVYRGCQNT